MATVDDETPHSGHPDSGPEEGVANLAATHDDARRPAPEDDDRDADQPGIAFDAALLTTTLGLAQRPVPVGAVAGLARKVTRRPVGVVRPAGRLVAEGARILAGRSKVDLGRKDRRYADPEWKESRVFRRLAQGHMAIANAAEEALQGAELSPVEQYRLQLLVSNVAAALAPANFPLLNPAALRAFSESRGESFVVGSRRLVKDLQTPPHLPARSEPADFKMGEDLAATPGAVVLRTPVMELIQYESRTPTVCAEPILFVPSLVNKYYLTDLSPGRSLIEYTVGAGVQTFHISWINPGPEHRDYDLGVYASSIVEAIEAMLEITGAERTHTLGVCAGGQLLSIALAYLAATGTDDRIASATMTVSVLDHGDAASPTGLLLLSPEVIETAMKRVDRTGYVDGRRLATSLAWLRPVDSIWWAWVQRYLLAADIPRMDLFHWSEDTSNLPAALVRQMLEMTLDNQLTKPGALTVLDQPVDLRRIKTPAYVIAGRTDNLTIWRSCYRTTNLLGSKATFVLVDGGHLQAILRPPGGRAAGYRTASGTPKDPDKWLARSELHDGTWWDHWLAWLRRRSSGNRPAPAALGDETYAPVEPAPGQYVRRRLDGKPA